MRFVKQAGLVENLTTTIRGALRMCREHALAGIELPCAYFTAGRFSLLLGQGHEALGYYARGIRYCLEGTHCIPCGLLAEEENWIRAGGRACMPARWRAWPATLTTVSNCRPTASVWWTCSSLAACRLAMMMPHP
jgi:hypothetical protein